MLSAHQSTNGRYKSTEQQKQTERGQGGVVGSAVASQLLGSISTEGRCVRHLFRVISAETLIGPFGVEFACSPRVPWHWYPHKKHAVIMVSILP